MGRFERRQARAVSESSEMCIRDEVCRLLLGGGGEHH